MEDYREKKYLILDSRQTPLARAVMESREDASQIQIRVLDGEVDEVMAHSQLQLVGVSQGTKNLFVHVIRARGDRVLLESHGAMSADVRENLRVPVRFTSHLYSLSDRWYGRRTYTAKDLSCGGMAFSCVQPLEHGEQVEIVLPVTSRPLVLRVQVLRELYKDGEETVYATQFVDIIDDEETLIREAVFGIQLRAMGKRGKKETAGKGTGLT